MAPMDDRSTFAYEAQGERESAAKPSAGSGEGNPDELADAMPEPSERLASIAEMLPLTPVARSLRREREAFGEFHPAVNFAFFAAAIVLCMCLRHPVFLACGVVLSFVYYLVLRGRSGLMFLFGMVIVMAMLTVLNPLINTMGNTVLFTYFGDRPYTLEAMVYGLAIGAMFVSVIVWFGCYHVIMTSDKFTFLFGSLAPSISQLFTMVLRLVPSYQRKLSEIGTARACAGKGVTGEGMRERLTAASSIMSALTSWALENGVVLADSMKSRGYGTGKRTAYALWRFTARDGVLLAMIAALVAVVLIAVSNGAAWVDYVPDVRFTTDTVFFVGGIVAYVLLLALPTIIDVRESLVWRISLSKI